MEMAAETKKERSWPALIGWGGLFAFALLFAWLIISQLQSAQTWDGRKEEAIELVRQFRPGGPAAPTLQDLTRGYPIKAKEKSDTYVGEFTWDARQKEGPDYEVTLLWTEGQKHRVAVWRVDLQSKEVRPQGDEAAALPEHAETGELGG
jgi:hypothetical protein